jgi:hypothetical protein
MKRIIVDLSYIYVCGGGKPFRGIDKSINPTMEIVNIVKGRHIRINKEAILNRDSRFTPDLEELKKVSLDKNDVSLAVAAKSIEMIDIFLSIKKEKKLEESKYKRKSLCLKSSIGVGTGLKRSIVDCIDDKFKVATPAREEYPLIYRAVEKSTVPRLKESYKEAILNCGFTDRQGKIVPFKSKLKLNPVKVMSSTERIKNELKEVAENRGELKAVSSLYNKVRKKHGGEEGEKLFIKKQELLAKRIEIRNRYQVLEDEEKCRIEESRDILCSDLPQIMAYSKLDRKIGRMKLLESCKYLIRPEENFKTLKVNPDENDIDKRSKTISKLIDYRKEHEAKNKPGKRSKKDGRKEEKKRNRIRGEIKDIFNVNSIPGKRDRKGRVTAKEILEGDIEIRDMTKVLSLCNLYRKSLPENYNKSYTTRINTLQAKEKAERWYREITGIEVNMDVNDDSLERKL